ncbi:MAG: hypothetical protein L0Y54_02450, partial [Sporichthyaceae bacterium]|nr:hypothetical protein [Sporichthyaceae bacterium]
MYARPRDRELAPLLDLPDSVASHDDDGHRPIGADQMVVVSAGDDPVAELRAAAGSILGRMAPTARLLLAIDRPADDDLVGAVDGTITQLGLAVLRADLLPYQRPRWVVLLAPKTSTGDGSPGGLASLAGVLNARHAGRARALDGQLAGLQRSLAQAEAERAATAEVAVASAAEAQAGRARIGKLEQRVRQLERSRSIRAARALRGVAQHPVRGSIRLPGELLRALRPDRMAPATGSARTAAEADRVERAEPAKGVVPSMGPVRPRWKAAGARLLSAHHVGLHPPPDPDRMVIAGVLGNEAEIGLADAATVLPLRPHDALAVLERTDPDLLLIDSTAFRPGQAWGHAGLDAPDRADRLRAAVRAARRAGIPVVAWQWATRPLSAVLVDLEPDLRFAALPGLPLSLYHPIDLAPDRPMQPVEVGAASLGAGPETVAARLRSNGLVVAADLDLAHAALACGARVIYPGPAAPGASSRLTAVDDDAAFAARVRELASAGPRPAAEVRAVLRELFGTHAVLTRLGELAATLDLGLDPLAGRRVSVLALPPFEDPSGLIEAVLRQQHRPAEILADLACPGAQRLDELVRAGIPVRALELPAGSATWWSGFGAASSSALVALWRDGAAWPATHLIDLVCAHECSGADVLGRWPDGAAGSDYVFAPAARPELIRRELLSDPVAGAPPELPVDAWARRGY